MKLYGCMAITLRDSGRPPLPEPSPPGVALTLQAHPSCDAASSGAYLLDKAAK